MPEHACVVNLVIKMADINRTNSPMNLYREDILDTKEELDKAREKLIGEQKKTAPFLVGSIERVNERIATLDRELQGFSELVIESKATNVPDDVLPMSARFHKGPQKASDVKELNLFAGVFAAKTTLFPVVTPKMKHLSKINESSKKITKDKGDTKPKLVELHQYMGYDPHQLTPLPDLETLTIIKRVTEAQTGLLRKPQYKQEFKRLFFSKMSEAVLVDTFWWFFLHRYHPSKKTQERLFNRIAHNYVKLLLFAKNPKHRDVFFQDYSDTLAQAIYSAFCAAFPNSWRQFDPDFKSDLCSLTSQWVVGTRPAPRTWLRWNYPGLEPPNMKREEFMKTDNKKGRLFDFDMLTPEDSSHSNPSRTVDPTNTHQQPPHNPLGKAKLSQTPSESSVPTAATGLIPQDSDFMSISTVARAQHAPLPLRGGARVLSGQTELGKGSTKTGGLLPISETSSEGPDGSECKTTKTRTGKKGRNSPRTDNVMPKNNRGKAKVSNSSSRLTLEAQASKSTTQSVIRPRNNGQAVESHPVGEGATFTKVIFNSNGQSPLVLHFLRQKGLDQKAGIDNLLRRTEIKKLPPMDAPTYKQLIQDTFHSIRHADDTYQMMYDDGLKTHTHFLKRQKQHLQEHMRREESLMAQPREMKRLSDLLVLELLKDHDEVSTGAALAVEDALLQQDQVYT
ncbi:protein FAM227B-like isoform X2 [Patiria miniata]|uniref:Protein FAM227B n=1 Tax=Patiria miniata TaxID=46514 RepID=A0A914AQA5_PATMI|nr:protein FAM227B-like isoform X2 [Patiria miniata]